MKLYQYILFFVFISFSGFAQKQKKHKVVSGESVYLIAKKYNVSVDDIFDANPKISKKSLPLNTVLVIPKTTNQKNNPESHEVQNGESYYSISKKYDIPLDELQKLNPKIASKDLKKGLILNLKKSKATKNETSTSDIVLNDYQPKDKIHTVKKGETLASIAKKYGVKLADLKKINPDAVASISVGDKIFISKSSETPIADYQDNKVLLVDKIHTVKKGDNLYSISKAYNLKVEDLKKLNPNLNKNISVGDKIIVGKIKETSKSEKTKDALTIISESSDRFVGIVSYEDHIEEPDDSGDLKYIVKKGETLYSISKANNLTLKQLKELNPSLRGGLSVGYVLLLKKGENIDSEKDKVVYAELEEYVPDAPELSFEGLTKAESAIAVASNQMGTRYRSGGTQVGGFDCSGLMLYSFDKIDLKLPRTSAEQSRYGKSIKRKQAQKGDLIFFSTNGRGNINHVGMVVEVLDDEIKFIHASVSNGVVVSSLNESYYAKRFKKLMRVLE